MFTKSDIGLVGGRIVETEAYCQNDPAAHCYDKNTPGNARETRMNGAMYCPPGYVYVYPNSRKWCHLNIVGRNPARQGKFGSAVLVRALEPTHNIDWMKELRKPYFSSRDKADEALENLWNLCSGPIKLCQALSINHDCFDKRLIKNTSLRLYNRPPDELISVYCDRRIGVPDTWPRRYVWNRSGFLSKPESNNSFECTTQRLAKLNTLSNVHDMRAFFETN